MPGQRSLGLHGPRRILLAQTSFAGDVILTLPLHDALAAALPSAEIHWLVRPGTVGLIAARVGRDRVHVFDKHGKDAGGTGLLRTSRRLRAGCFDAALAVQRSARTGLMLALAGIPFRAGFADAPGRWLYHRRVPRRGNHASERLLALAEAFGVAVEGFPAQPRLVVEPAAAQRIDALLERESIAAGARLLIVAPGSAWATKRWPPPAFGSLTASLVPACFDVALVVGTAGDSAACADAVRAASGARVVDLCDRTDAAELVALLARASAAVANDSAVGHIAAALDVPLVSIFGPTVPEQGFAPRGARVRLVGLPLDCRPCSRHGTARCPLGTHACMVDLDVGRVRETLLAGLESGQSGQVAG